MSQNRKIMSDVGPYYVKPTFEGRWEVINRQTKKVVAVFDNDEKDIATENAANQNKAYRSKQLETASFLKTLTQQPTANESMLIKFMDSKIKENIELL